MNKATCPKCGKVISVSASRCEYCRATFPKKDIHQPKRSEALPLIAVAVSLSVLISILVNKSTLFPETPLQPQPPVARISPDPPAVERQSLSEAPARVTEKIVPELRPSRPVQEIKVNNEICTAVKDNKPEVVRRLLEQGMSPDSVDEHGLWTPLMIAIESDNREMVEILVDKGADPNLTAPNSPDIPLMYAMNIPMVELMVKRGADVNLQNRLTGLSVMTAAIYNQSPELLEYYIRAGVDVNIRDRKGMTPLMLASKLCRPALVEILLKRGALVNARDKNGQSAMGYVTGSGPGDRKDKSCSEVYIFLRDHGATL